MKFTLLASFLISTTLGFSQSKKHKIVLRSNVMTFKFIDFNNPGNESTWTLTPGLNPDTYKTGDKEVWFCTDLDTLKVAVTKKKPIVDFIVIYNEKDTFNTRIEFVEVIDYLARLKNAGTYNLKDKRKIPAFTYQDKNHPALVALRKEHNLDSIAGTGTDISQLLNVMHWLHSKVRHDGNNGNPDTKNASAMISACKDGSRGLNCRGLGITLNECYLALGFKSRYATCMPKEVQFDDCHVINTVYVPSLSKWVYLDPTHDAYVQDENGQFLSIEEVRDRLVHGKPLVLNPSANWNNQENTSKEYYLDYYMAKNLYRIECPLSSEYNLETREQGKNREYIELLPLDALKSTSKFEEVNDKNLNRKTTMYKTNNPTLFWAIPKFN